MNKKNIYLLIIKMNLRKISLIFFINLILSIYIIESFLTIFELQNTRKIKNYISSIVENHNNSNQTKFDLTGEIDFIKNLNKNKIKIWPRISPYSYVWERKEDRLEAKIKKDDNKKIVDSIFLSGRSNVLTAGCNENSYYSTFISDRYGFSNNDKIWDNKIIEYLIIGDSFAMGDCVNSHNTIAHNLNNLGLSSISLGYPGNGPLLELASMIEYITGTTKKIVWLFYEGNDFEDFEIELEDPLLLNYLNNNSFNQNLIHRQHEIDFILDKKLEKVLATEEKGGNFISINTPKFYFTSKSFLKFYKTRMFIKKIIKKNNNKKIIVEFEKVIKTAKSIAEKNNSQFCFVYLPEINRYNQDYFYKFISKKDKVLNILKKNNINTIDASLVFNSKMHKFFFSYSGAHYNEKGYLKISNLIYENC